jgi:hypothetical protein
MNAIWQVALGEDPAGQIGDDGASPQAAPHRIVEAGPLAGRWIVAPMTVARPVQRQPLVHEPFGEANRLLTLRWLRAQQRAADRATNALRTKPNDH